MVGAVLVHQDRIIGEGWHKQYGQPHAEVNCLESVQEADKHLIPESIMYVSLEPCAHHGKTPPCAVRLVQEQVKEVIISNTDPYEAVAGRGIDILQMHGIDVTTGVSGDAGLWLNRRFFCFHQQKRPYIILKWAQTPDRHFAPADRSRCSITNGESQALVHKWRTEEAAIMIGYNTALNDDPQLTSRIWAGKQPLRIVVDRNLQLPHTHNVYKPDARTWIINEQSERVEEHMRFVKLKFEGLLITEVLKQLHEASILSVIIEGGAALLNSFIEQGYWDEARVLTGQTRLPQDSIIAPVLSNAVAAFETEIGTDNMEVYINNKSAYKYVPGMEL